MQLHSSLDTEIAAQSKLRKPTILPVIIAWQNLNGTNNLEYNLYTTTERAILETHRKQLPAPEKLLRLRAAVRPLHDLGEARLKETQMTTAEEEKGGSYSANGGRIGELGDRSANDDRVVMLSGRATCMQARDRLARTQRL